MGPNRRADSAISVREATYTPPMPDEQPLRLSFQRPPPPPRSQADSHRHCGMGLSWHWRAQASNKKEENVSEDTDMKSRETAVPSGKSTPKRTCHGVNHSIHPSPAAPPLSPVRFQPATHPQTEVWSWEKARGLAQVEVRHLSVNTGSSWDEGERQGRKELCPFQSGSKIQTEQPWISGVSSNFFGLK